jgi:hypothetical protein
MLRVVADHPAAEEQTVPQRRPAEETRCAPSRQSLARQPDRVADGGA